MFMKEKTLKTSQESRWIKKAIKMAEEEQLPIFEIEEYDYGTIIRFAHPKNPGQEADIFLAYKTVEWLSESARELKSSGYDIIETENRNYLRWVFTQYGFINGYKLTDEYDGFAKKIEIVREAINEVKILISIVDEIKGKFSDLIGGYFGLLGELVDQKIKDEFPSFPDPEFDFRWAYLSRKYARRRKQKNKKLKNKS